MFKFFSKFEPRIFPWPPENHLNQRKNPFPNDDLFFLSSSSIEITWTQKKKKERRNIFIFPKYSLPRVIYIVTCNCLKFGQV